MDERTGRDRGLSSLEPESYNVQLFDNRLEVYVDQTGMKFPMLIKPLWNMIVKMTAGPLSNKQCFDIAFLLGTIHKLR